MFFVVPTVATTQVSVITSASTRSQSSYRTTVPSTSHVRTRPIIFPPIPRITYVEEGWNYLNITWLSERRTVDLSISYFVRYKEQTDENITCYNCQESSPVYEHYYLLRNLRNDTIYLIQVVAVNNIGRSYSPILQVKTKGTII